MTTNFILNTQQRHEEGVLSSNDQNGTDIINEMSILVLKPHVSETDLVKTYCFSAPRLSSHIFLSNQPKRCNLDLKALNSINRDLKNEHQLITSITIKEAKEISNTQIQYNFAAEEPLLNLRFIHDEIASLKKSLEITQRLRFLHEFCQIIWFLLTEFAIYWHNLDNVIIANIKSGNIRYLLLGCSYYIQLPAKCEYTLRAYVKKARNDFPYQKHLTQICQNYISYFDKLTESLFDRDWRYSLRSQYSNKSNYPLYRALISKIDGLLETLRTPEANPRVLERFWSSLFSLYLAETAPQCTKSKTAKQTKIEKKSDRLNRIMECMPKYTYCFVLDITNIAQEDLKTLEKAARNSGVAEYHFYPLHAFIKRVLPHTQQFKDLKAQGIENNELMDALKNDKGQIGLFFSNQEICEAQTLITSCNTQRSVCRGLGKPIKETKVLPHEKILVWNYYSRQRKNLFENFGAEAEFDVNFLRPKTDITLKKGMVIGKDLIAIQERAFLSESPLKSYYNYRIKILHIFENGYLLPKQVVNRVSNKEEIIDRAITNCFSQIQAVQIQTGLGLTDLSDVFQAQARFADGLRMLLAISVQTLHKVPSKLERHVVEDKPTEQWFYTLFDVESDGDDERGSF